MLTCEFCTKNFKTTSSLNAHKKTTKYCLKIQNDLQNSIENELKSYICKFCDSNLKSKKSLDYHENICKTKKDIIISELEKNLENNEKINSIKINEFERKHKIEIEKIIKYHNLDIKNYTNKILKLEEKINDLENIVSDKELHITRLETLLEVYQEDHSELKNIHKTHNNTILDIAKQPKTTNTNNVINNLAVYDINKITEKFVSNLDFLTKEDIINGQRGIADKILPYLYDENGKKMVTCTDHARLVFTRIDENNNRSKDFELKELASVIKPFAIKRADEIVNRQNKIREKIYNIENIKKQIKDYNNYIDQYYKQIENSSNKKCRQDYLKKIDDLENKIEELKEELYSFESEKEREEKEEKK